MKYGKVSLGQIEAIVNKLCGEKGLNFFLGDKISFRLVDNDKEWERISSLEDYQESDGRNMKKDDTSKLSHDDRHAIFDSESITTHRYFKGYPVIVEEVDFCGLDKNYIIYFCVIFEK